MNLQGSALCALKRVSIFLPLFLSATAFGQFKTDEPAGGVRFGEAKTQKYRVGVEVTAAGGPCRRLYATLPVPDEWPEQEVRITEEDVSPEVKRVRYRTLDDGVKQMIVEIPMLAGGATARAVVTFEVTRRAILAPDDPSGYKAPRRPSRDIGRYLGASPYIETRNTKIRALAKELTDDVEGDWQQVEAIYDGVRERVEYRDGDLKGALAALRDGYGDCEELSSLFIALCRANRIPARTVWIPGHCYPEFYLEDAEGNGHWFPCQAAGTRAFGEMPEFRPVLQKGDNFRDPDRSSKPRRYVSEFMRGVPVPGGGQPQVKWIREAVD